MLLALSLHLSSQRSNLSVIVLHKNVSLVCKLVSSAGFNQVLRQSKVVSMHLECKSSHNVSSVKQMSMHVLETWKQQKQPEYRLQTQQNLHVRKLVWLVRWAEHKLVVWARTLVWIICTSRKQLEHRPQELTSKLA